MQKIKMGLMVVLGLLMMTQPVMAVKCPAGSLRAGQTLEFASQCNVPADEKNHDAMSTIRTIINFLIGITAIIAVFVVIIAGIQMATSQGDAAKVAKSRNMILYGIIGLVIAILAFAIVNYVLEEAFL